MSVSVIHRIETTRFFFSSLDFLTTDTKKEEDEADK